MYCWWLSDTNEISDRFGLFAVNSQKLTKWCHRDCTAWSCCRYNLSILGSGIRYLWQVEEPIDFGQKNESVLLLSSAFFFRVFVLAPRLRQRGSCRNWQRDRKGQVPADTKVLQGSWRGAFSVLIFLSPSFIFCFLEFLSLFYNYLICKFDNMYQNIKIIYIAINCVEFVDRRPKSIWSKVVCSWWGIWERWWGGGYFQV